MSVKRKASLERRVGQVVERRESAEAERSGSRSGEEAVTESSSCSAMRRTRSSETAGAARAADTETEAAGRRNRRRGGGARSGVEQETAHSDGGDMATAKLRLRLWKEEESRLVAAEGMTSKEESRNFGETNLFGRLTGGARKKN